MSMTIDEMKLAVCEKLPELIQWRRGAIRWMRDDEPRVNWPTEGLQVCHEAEKLLSDEQYATYAAIFDLIECNCYPNTIEELRKGISAPYEQRLEALCRVWWPERFV